jgi:predicted Zn-ribbon and HTH transcriptional regulator
VTLNDCEEEQEASAMQNTPQNTPRLDNGIPQHLLEQPAVCAECGLQVSTQQIADTCDLCGAPRCRSCASQAGDPADAIHAGGYICSSCAAED